MRLFLLRSRVARYASRILKRPVTSQNQAKQGHTRQERCPSLAVSQARLPTLVAPSRRAPIPSLRRSHHLPPQPTLLQSCRQTHLLVYPLQAILVCYYLPPNIVKQSPSTDPCPLVHRPQLLATICSHSFVLLLVRDTSLVEIMETTTSKTLLLVPNKVLQTASSSWSHQKNIKDMIPLFQ